MSIPVEATWHRGIDLVAVKRMVYGMVPRPALTEEEQRYVCRAMSQTDWSAAEIAERLGVAERTVTRWRREDNAP